PPPRGLPHLPRRHGSHRVLAGEFRPGRPLAHRAERQTARRRRQLSRRAVDRRPGRPQALAAAGSRPLRPQSGHQTARLGAREGYRIHGHARDRPHGTIDEGPRLPRRTADPRSGAQPAVHPPPRARFRPDRPRPVTPTTDPATPRLMTRPSLLRPRPFLRGTSATAALPPLDSTSLRPPRAATA